MATDDRAPAGEAGQPDLHTTAGKIADLDRRRQEAVHAGSQRAVERQHAKGKMTARERVGRLLDQARQLAGPPPLLVHHRLRLDPVHADEAGLGQRQYARCGEQDDDDDDEDGVLGVEAGGGDHGPGTCSR